MSRAGLALILLSSLAGCGTPDIMGTPLHNDPSGVGGGGTGTTSTGGGSCVQLQPEDPSTLPACCQGVGDAHCVAADKIPSNLASQLNTCPSGGYCVPDTQIKSGGAAPPTCKSLNGADGVCLSLCVPQVSMYKDLLPQDVCAAAERCAPCINPLNNMPSGACDIGKSTGCDPGAGGSGGGGTGPAPAMCPYTGPPLIDPATLPSCSTAGGAHCLKASLVPSTMASQLATCQGSTDLCVPDVFIESASNYVPKTCSSLDNAEGRCLHVAIPQVAKQASMLTQDVCQAYEKCVPCYSPIDGMPTGSCKLSCDPGPTRAAVTFQACCSKNNAPQGKCVPKTVIPSTLQSNLSTDTCQNSNTDLCVPTENLNPDFKPMACTGQGLIGGQYTGVCLSKCLKFGFIQQLGISQGSCDNLHDCAPCTNPLTGQPTGAPGCPNTP
jgi:hypothetical protein